MIVARDPVLHPSVADRDELAPKRSVDLPRIAAAVREILAAAGDDPDRDGLRETPQRVARAYADLFGGLHETPDAHLARVFEQQCDDVVIVSGIEIYSLCEHHLLPFFGQAHVAYLPSDGKVVGLSKLARTVDVFARRPQVQERLTAQVADALVDALDPLGAMVVIEAEHMCMKMRGVEKHCGRTVTRAVRGVFKSDAAARRETLDLMRNPAGA